MTNESKFFGEKLKLARFLNGLTQADIAAQLGVTRQFVYSLETGSKAPSRDMTAALALLLNVEAVFFHRSQTRTISEEQCHFRSRRTTPLGCKQQIIAHGILFGEIIERMEEELSLPPVNIPKVELKEQANEIEDAAQLCRHEWRLGDGPITNVCRVVENRAGAVITECEGVSEKVDALSVSLPRPIVVRNPANHSIPRTRFDLAHEVGHWVMHEGQETGDAATELQANRFASAFLLPKKTFSNSFPRFSKKLDWTALYKLKGLWGVSVAAILYRARELELIDAAQFYSGYTFLSRTGQRKVERYDELVQKEQPELLDAALKVYESRATGTQLGEALGLKPNLLRKILGNRILSDLPAEVGSDLREPTVVSLSEYREKKIS